MFLFSVPFDITQLLKSSTVSRMNWLFYLFPGLYIIEFPPSPRGEGEKNLKSGDGEKNQRGKKGEIKKIWGKYNF